MTRNRSSAHTKAQKAGRERDGNRCQICGSRNRVEGHHIVDYQFGGAASVDNIIALCRKHHIDVHSGKIDIFII
ncbi:MAG: HNH endonuclease [Acetatifactor sp.]|nr:HNH endonuclease [Acetatifactor sp.]